jgi:hypothetical protein
MYVARGGLDPTLSGLAVDRHIVMVGKPPGKPAVHVIRDPLQRLAERETAAEKGRKWNTAPTGTLNQCVNAPVGLDSRCVFDSKKGILQPPVFTGGRLAAWRTAL